MGDDKLNFDAAFCELTGNSAPLSWHTRLYEEHFIKGDLPPVIDIPTGLGKTMIMAIWLIARRECPDKVPTRLIYVVDRRTVVDQATDLAKRLWCKFGNDKLAISTLRGQLADNREWSRDPSKPAIIIGTVDLIGSALLFSGYRSSYKRRPLEAGLLGQDSLLVLDEAHLSKPFEKLIRAIGGAGSFQKNRDRNTHGKPMRVIRMSATSGDSTNSESPFTLQFDETGNLTSDDAKDAIITERFGAKKRLTITTLGDKHDLNKKLVEAAIELALNSDLIGKRIVVFVRKPDDATKIADAIRKHEITKAKQGPYADSVEVLTGTMRGLERDELIEKPVLKRFLDGEETPNLEENKKPVFLISTSAGEVGFDLNADHLVGDAAPLDSWIQRLGRVNRRGNGDATVVLIHEPIKTNDKDGKPRKLEGLEKSIATTLDLLRGVSDVSPKNIAALKKSEKWKEKYKDACSPEPTMVELTDILLDAWSMTSISEPMPGRPEVGPWLRGIADELPQTTIAWRAELELVKAHPDPVKALQSIFSKHPIRPHELVTTYSYRVVEFLVQACKLKDRPSNLSNTPVALHFTRGKIVLRTIKELADDPGILDAEPTLVLPATFGGLNAAGTLDADAIRKTPKADDPPPPSLDVADHPGYEQRENASPRLRLLIHRSDDDTWAPEFLPDGAAASARSELQATYPTSTALFADLRQIDLRIRLVQPIELDAEGDAVRSLVMLSPVSNKNKSDDQSLDDHVGAVEKEARRTAAALGLAENDPVRTALLFAARWHDEGKKADVWQQFVYGPDSTGHYKGKSSKSRDPKSLRGYRHEFGSLLRIHHFDRCNTTGCILPMDHDVRELALHLIATHHGASRPHFEPGNYTPFTTGERDTLHTESIRRFAQLQRRYGWWHLAWLENLLRCADALASADNDAEDDPTDVKGAES